jgi:hypothetical protein
MKRGVLLLYLMAWLVFGILTRTKKAGFFIAGYDSWVGVFKSTKSRYIKDRKPEIAVIWYVCLLPCLVFVYPRFPNWVEIK